MKRYKLSGVAWALILTLGAVLLGSLYWVFIRPMFGGDSEAPNPTETEQSQTRNTGKTPDEDILVTLPDTETMGEDVPATNDTEWMNVSLDEFSGYIPFIMANGGYETTPDSIYGKLGLKLRISVINDPTTSSNALINGKLDGAGYTGNRVAFLSNKFAESGIQIVFPMFSSYSKGADGIIATKDINTVHDLLGKRIGAPQYGESHAMLVWLINEADDLTDEEKVDRISSIILFSGAEETGSAFFANQLDAAATWQPYLDMAKTGSKHVLFDTKSAKTFIMSGVIFNKEYAESHRDDIVKFIKGFYEATTTEWANFDTLRGVMPMFAEMSDDEIRQQMNDVEFTTYNENKTILSKTAPENYALQCKIWESVGEQVNYDLGRNLFDKSYNEALKDQFQTTRTMEKSEPMTPEKKQEVIDYPALLTKRYIINFVGNVAEPVNEEEAYNTLDGFVETARVLGGSIIEIKGYVNANEDSDFSRQLSLARANFVKDYLVRCGIDENRIITLGMGATDLLVPVGSDNDYLNRRMEGGFKLIEGDHRN